MGGLYYNICDPIAEHLLHGFFYSIYNDPVAFFELGNDHLACPRTVGWTGRECIGNIALNSINGNFTRILVACAEADYKDRFF